ncbi:MAG: PASTA domain-containing protein [Oscillospiraceae bacterium]|jgi:beta-lactam-binding protein with PASTA domain/serine/threonine protein kinase|nr:PASTA domain-containing protein [Oscillospiraceae bacterium]
MSICKVCGNIYDNGGACPRCGHIQEYAVTEPHHLEPGFVLRERYVVGRALGGGGFGVTYLGWDRQGERSVAIKEYLPVEFSARAPGAGTVTMYSDAKKQKQFGDGLTRFKEEAEKLQKFQGEDGVIQIYDTFSFNETAYFVMEYLNGATLADLLERGYTFTARDAISLLAPILKSLSAVHAAGIIHRDVAPENIFITQTGSAKLIDFAAARYSTTSHSRSLTVLVKQGYSPIEQYDSRSDQGPHTDVYAVAGVIYRMITGFKPPDAMDRRVAFRNGMRDNLAPIHKYTKDIAKGEEIAVLNALNIQKDDRTPDAGTFFSELTGAVAPKRRRNRIHIEDLPLWVKISLPAAMAGVAALVVLLATGVIGFDSGLAKDITIPDGMTRVPSVVNSVFNEAENRLEEALLLYSIDGKEYSNTIPADFVLVQSINAGSIVDINTIVPLIISGGAKMALVPDLRGESAALGIQRLQELGFDVRTLYDYDQLIAEDGIVRMGADPNTEFAVGETIILYISRGRDPDSPAAYMSAVPQVTGLTYQEAIDAAGAAGFQISVSARDYSPTAPEGAIMSQTLRAGGREMTDQVLGVTVSLGVRKSRMPDVVFNAEADAKRAIEAEGLSVVITYKQSETFSKGIVISQDPAAKTELAYGGGVSIVVSSGGALIPVPSVVGKTEAEARSALVGKALKVTASYEYSDAYPEGSVIRQSVAPGAEVSRGSEIVITVSSGAKLAEIPNVTGQSRSAAESALKSAGFRVTVNEVYNDSVAKGYVVSQTPAAGSKQAANTSVILTVSLGAEPIVLPNFVGSSQSIAERTLAAYGLRVEITSQYHDTVQAGCVISQDPRTGAVLERGNTVRLVVSLGPETSNIPSVMGLTYDEAVRILKAMNLNLTIQRYDEYDSFYAEGRVAGQNPPPGYGVERNAAVTLIVSRGSAPLSVANVVGADESTARYTLQQQGFAVSVVYAEHATVPAGTVLSQTPAAGVSAQAGAAVTITVSRGPGTVSVPNVVGADENTARYTLQQQGFAVSVAYAHHATVPAGTVISQNPAANASAQAGAAVTITVSNGPEALPVVPNVVGLDESAAKSALQQQGFNVSVVSANHATVPAGSVLSQTPAAGVSAQAGAAVTITVSLGPETVSVPDVVGLDESAAKSALQMLGFNVSVVSANHATVPAGKVLSQTPAAGVSAQAGTAVTIIVSSGPGVETVPNVVGLDESAAKSALQLLGFTVSVVYADSSTVPAGKVISQTPEANASKQKGSEVKITVSLGSPTPSPSP